jgi:HicB family
MELDRYVADLRAQLAAAAESGGEDVRAVAERLNVALDAAARLMLLEALSDAASEITRELVPGAVDVRLRGRDPEFVVSRPTVAEFADVAPAAGLAPAPGAFAGSASASRTPAAPAELTDDTPTSRTTLRLPDQLKARVDTAAAEDGLSVNAWLVRAIAAALEPKNRRTNKRESRAASNFTGWVR